MHKKNHLLQVARVLAGCCIFAAGLNLFVIPAGLYSGGVVGLTQLIDHAWRCSAPGAALQCCKSIYDGFFGINSPHSAHPSTITASTAADTGGTL